MVGDRGERLDPARHPAGTRLLWKRSRPEGPIFESEVVEWSRGGRVKLRYAQGNCDWLDLYCVERAVVLEVLEPKLSSDES